MMNPTLNTTLTKSSNSYGCIYTRYPRLTNTIETKQIDKG
jgi:hypothetical protein